MNKRFASAASSSALITLSLLFVMQALIGIQPGAQSEIEHRGTLSFVRVPEPEETRPIDDYSVQKKELTRSDPTPPRSRYPGENTTINVPRTAPIPPAEGLRTTLVGFTDGPLVALVRVEPTYPVKASTAGLEGYVIVQFDVSPDGRVVNALVVESSDRVFDRSALRAAEKFKYKPRIVDGVALETRGMRSLFRFNLDD